MDVGLNHLRLNRVQAVHAAGMLEAKTATP